MMKETIYSLFKNQVLAHPESLAIIDESREVTYKELDRMIDNLISLFIIGKTTFIGIVIDHSIEMIATIFAVLKSGAAYVPVEPTFPIERINYIMKETDVDFIITQKKYSDILKGFKQLIVEPGKEIENKNCAFQDKSSSNSMAYVLYTSGTTGRPKGVLVTNHNICHYIHAFENEFHVNVRDKMLQYSVCTFDIFVEEVFTTLLNGATLAIPSEQTKNDIHKLMQFVEDHNITIISAFPYLLLEINKLKEIPSSIRLLISGGDVLRASYVSNLIDKVVIYNTYGPSETTVCASYYRCNRNKALPNGTYPIGKAITDVNIKILDKNLEEVQDGDIGEICIFGEGISYGYLGNKPESINFTNSPDRCRVYRSGDLGYKLSDGNIVFSHRKDKQVMILGKRVECDEVENILCSYNEVELGIVCHYIDTQGLSYLVAYIIPRSKKFSLIELKQEMLSFLTPFMIPEFFVTMKEFPTTPNGKIDRSALPIVLKEGNL